jgi:hypothetical protein
MKPIQKRGIKTENGNSPGASVAFVVLPPYNTRSTAKALDSPLARVKASGQYSAMICAGIPNLVCPVEFASPRLTTPVEIPTSVNCRTVL